MAKLLREAAADFIEAGRLIGMAEECEFLDGKLFIIHEIDYPEDPAAHAIALHEQLDQLRAELRQRRVTAVRLAATAQGAAERFMEELEHPGARLARRLLRAARGARRAWQGTCA
jgi:hypothetical protein